MSTLDERVGTVHDWLTQMRLGNPVAAPAAIAANRQTLDIGPGETLEIVHAADPDYNRLVSLLEHVFDAGAPLIPAMAGPSNDLCTVSASSTYSDTFAAPYAADRKVGTSWSIGAGKTTGWWRCCFTTPVTVAAYAILAPGLYGDSAPRDWTLRGSNDGVNWTVLDAEAGVTWTNGQRRQYSLAQPATFSCWEIIGTGIKPQSMVQDASTREAIQSPEDNLFGEGNADPNGVALAGLEPGTLQILEPGEDIKFSQPADVGSSYSEFLRMQFRAVAAAMGVTYEQLTGDLTQVNYSSIRAGLLEFRRRVEALQHGVIVHQLCRPIWQSWMAQAVLEGALTLPGYARGGVARQRQYLAVKWIPQGWQWVDPLKEADAMKAAIRSGLMSRSEAISANGYDAEDVDREIAADNARADALGLVFDSDPRHELPTPAPVLPPDTSQQGQ